MADLLFVAVALVFFALAAGYVTACERLVGRGRLENDEAAGDHIESDAPTVTR